MAGAETKSLSAADGKRLQPVDVIDQLPQTRRTSAVRGEDQTGQIFEIRFVELFGQGAAKLEGAFEEQISKLFMDGGHLLRRDRAEQSHRHLAADVAGRVKPPIEHPDFLD